MKLRSQFGEWFSGRGWALVLSAALAVLLPLSSAAGPSSVCREGSGAE